MLPTHADDRHDLSRASAATRAALIAAGERLFGRDGIDAVSLLTVVREAGQGNKNAVQYHFGSKEGLLLAILRNRADLIDRRRGELLVEAGAGNTLDAVPSLVRAMFLPVIEQCDAEGRFTYARFLVQYLHHPRYPSGPVPAAAIGRDLPFTNQLKSLLQRQLPFLSEDLINWRVAMQLRFVASCLVEFDATDSRGHQPMDRDRLVEEILATASVGMSVPV
jgi:AcrR family transcriptional regulator